MDGGVTRTGTCARITLGQPPSSAKRGLLKKAFKRIWVGWRVAFAGRRVDWTARKLRDVFSSRSTSTGTNYSVDPIPRGRTRSDSAVNRIEGIGTVSVLSVNVGPIARNLASRRPAPDRGESGRITGHEFACIARLPRHPRTADSSQCRFRERLRQINGRGTGA